MIEVLVKFVLSKLLGFNSDQWDSALSKVLELGAIGHLTNDERAVNFVKWFHGITGKEFKTWMVETFRNLVVAYARKKNLITP